MTARSFSGQTLTARYLTLSTGEAFSKLCVLAAFAYLARVLGPRDFGLIELSLSVTLFFTLTVELGLGSYGARTVAADPDRTPRLIARVILLRALLAVPAYGGILYLSARYGMPGIGVLAIYGLTVLMVPLFAQWVFQGLGRMRLVAGGTALRNFVFSFAVLLLLQRAADPRLVAVAEVLGVAAFAAFNLFALLRVLRIAIDWRGSLAGARELFADAWAIGASEVTWAGLWYSPNVVLGAFTRPEEVAWLAGPIRIVMALHTFVWLYFFNLLPGLSKACADGRDAWRDLAGRSLSTSMWLACLVAVSVTLLAPEIVTVVYGPAYGRAALPLQIVIWMIPVAWLSGHFRYSLIAAGHQRWEFYAAAATAVATLLLALLLVPRSGSIGGALALLGGGVLNAVLTAVAMERGVGSLNTLSAIARPAALAAVCLAAGFGLAPIAGSFVAAATGAILFGAVAMHRDSELVRLRQAWLGR